MAGFSCDVCGGKVVSSGKQDWFVCENCGSEYPLEWMKAKYQQGMVVQVEGIATVDNLIARALQYAEQMNYEKATEYCERVMDLDIKNARARKLLDEIALKKMSVKDVDRALCGAFERISLFQQKGDLNAIEQELRSVFTIDPDNKNAARMMEQLQQWRCYEVAEGSKLQGFTGDWADLIIPHFITEICDGAFEENKVLRSIKIPYSVSRIGRNAFKQCLNLESVALEFSKDPSCTIISPTVGGVYIEDYAFYRCSKLKQIANSSMIRGTGMSTFEGCVSLSGVVSMKGAYKLGARTFYGCKSIDMIVLGSNAGSENGELGTDALATMGNTMIEASKVPNDRLANAGVESAKRQLRKDVEMAEESQRECWMRSGLCQHCGGKFKGFFKETCIKCGKTKDY